MMSMDAVLGRVIRDTVDLGAVAINTINDDSSGP